MAKVFGISTPNRNKLIGSSRSFTSRSSSRSSAKKVTSSPKISKEEHVVADQRPIATAAEYFAKGEQCFQQKDYELAKTNYLSAVKLIIPKNSTEDMDLARLERKCEAAKILLRVNDVFFKQDKLDHARKSLESADMMVRQVLQSNDPSNQASSDKENSSDASGDEIFLMQHSSFRLLSEIMWKKASLSAKEGNITLAEKHSREAVICKRNSLNIIKFRERLNSNSTDMSKLKFELGHQLKVLAGILQRRGNYREAANIYSEALTVRQGEHQVGEHQEVLSLTNSLSQAYEQNKEYTSAIQCVNVLIQYYRKPENNTEGRLFTFIIRKSQLLILNEEYDAAMDLAQEGLQFIKNSSNTKHAKTLQMAVAMEQIAKVFEKKIMLEECLKWLNKAFLVRAAVLAESDELLAKSSIEIAKIYCKQGEFAKGKMALKGIRDKSAKTYGINHPIVALLLETLGDLYLEQKVYTNALKCYMKTLEIRRRCKPYKERSCDVAVAMRKIGVALLKKGRKAEAMQSFSEALDALRRSHFSKHHPLVGKTIHDMTAFEHDEDELESTSVFL